VEQERKPKWNDEEAAAKSINAAPISLSDVEWRTIADLVGLPDEARHPLEDRMTLFCQFVRRRKYVDPKETREKLLKLCTHAESFSVIDTEVVMALVDCASDKNPIASISATSSEVIMVVEGVMVVEDCASDKNTEVISEIRPKLIEVLAKRPSDINPTAMRDALNLLSERQLQLRVLADWCKTAAERVKLHKPGRPTLKNSNGLSNNAL
jgi:hypothetical protein